VPPLYVVCSEQRSLLALGPADGRVFPCGFCPVVGKPVPASDRGFALANLQLRNRQPIRPGCHFVEALAQLGQAERQAAALPAWTSLAAAGFRRGWLFVGFLRSLQFGRLLLRSLQGADCRCPAGVEVIGAEGRAFEHESRAGVGEFAVFQHVQDRGHPVGQRAHTKAD